MMSLNFQILHKFFSKLSFNFFSLIGSFSIEFKWEDDAEGDIYFKKLKGIYKLVWYVREFCTYIQFPSAVAYLYWQWNSYQDNPDKSKLSELIINGCFASGALFCATLQFMFHRSKAQIISLVNQTIKLGLHFEQKYNLKNAYQKDKKTRTTLLSLLFLSYLNQVIGVMMPYYVTNPTEGRYLSSYILNPYFEDQRTKTIALVVGFLFEFWYTSTQFGGMALQFYINSLYLQTMSTSMEAIQRISSSRWNGGDSKQFLLKLEAYSKLRLLATMYNQTMGTTFLPRFQSSAGFGCVCATFVFIKLVSASGPLDEFAIGLTAMGTVLFGVSFFSIAHFCSKIHERSLSLQKHLLEQRLPGKLAEREMNCFKVVGVNIGRYYLVKKETPLTMLAVVSNTTMTLLISNNFSL